MIIVILLTITRPRLLTVRLLSVPPFNSILNERRTVPGMMSSLTLRSGNLTVKISLALILLGSLVNTTVWRLPFTPYALWAE